MKSLLHNVNNITAIDMDYTGMTVNERLYYSGLFDQFYQAKKEKDIKLMEEILIKVELDQTNINQIIKDSK